MIWPVDMNMRDLQVTQGGADGGISIGEGSLFFGLQFLIPRSGLGNSIMGMYVCPCACWFWRKLSFRVIGCNIFVIDEWYCCLMRLMLSEDLRSVNLRHEIYMYICGMLLLMTLMLMFMIMWHEVMLSLMVILKWDGVDVGNVIKMR